MHNGVSLILPFCGCVYRAESLSQVFFILRTWLFSLIENSNVKPENMYLAYDNMCNICRLKTSQRQLPLDPPFQEAWLHLNKIIDSLHLVNDVNPECHSKYSPEPLKISIPTPILRLGNRHLYGWAGSNTSSVR